ncbi:MAG: phosphate-starvation-inducible PsiE family protein [Deinococcota bacterium]
MTTKKSLASKAATKRSLRMYRSHILKPLRVRLVTLNELLEDLIAFGVVILLFAIAVYILWDSSRDVILMLTGRANFSVTLLSQIMLALILAEIIATVNVFLKSGIFSPVPFLVVAVIASVRRILQISIENKGVAEATTVDTGLRAFNSLSVELALLTATIGVCAWAIHLLRQKNIDVSDTSREEES